MTARQVDMFGRPPRAMRGQLMHVYDIGGSESNPDCQMRCKRCGFASEWLRFDSVTEAKRGLPCPACNGNRAEGE